MVMKIVAGIIAIVLVIAFVLPPALKLEDPAMIVVIGLGMVLMIVDLWQSLHERD